MSSNPPGKLANIGPKSAAWLRQVGVRTEEDLRKLGAVGVFLKVKRAGFRPSLNLLYALAGAELGIHWAQLDPDYKAQLVQTVTDADAAEKLKKKFVTPARDIPVESYGGGSGDGGAVVDTDPGLFESTDGEATDVGDAGAGDAGTGGGGEIERE